MVVSCARERRPFGVAAALEFCLWFGQPRFWRHCSACAVRKTHFMRMLWTPDCSPTPSLPRLRCCSQPSVVSQVLSPVNPNIFGRIIDHCAHGRTDKNLMAWPPEGLDLVIGETGMKLSGSEKQRLSIAQALIRHPRLLIFDEAASALASITRAMHQPQPHHALDCPPPLDPPACQHPFRAGKRQHRGKQQPCGTAQSQGAVLRHAAPANGRVARPARCGGLHRRP